MSKTNDNKQPVAVENMQPQAPPPPNEVFIRVGTTLYKVVDQPTINGGKVRKRIPWNMETLRQDYGKEFIKYVHKYDGFCTVPEHVNHRTVIDGFLNLYEPISHKPMKGDFPNIKKLLFTSSVSNTSLAWTICNCSISDLCRNFQFFCLCLRRGTQARPRS